ncbi:MAG: hypothetical protein OXL37_15150 [Chloroflexota bacterium]|nr:hypothetical protein [Chloroflexota bacterium]MDE2961722.1 hypothetical protein [Chloroflexota bacterium]
MMIYSPNRPIVLAVLLWAAMLVVFSLACAPASNDAGMSMDMEGMEVDESNLNLKIGEQTPPFAMILSDGTQVSSADLSDEDQPAHLFWFATW